MSPSPGPGTGSSLYNPQHPPPPTPPPARGPAGRRLCHNAPTHEPVRVALARVDRDNEAVGDRAGSWDPRARVRGHGGLARLPEDRLTPADLREDELRVGQSRTVQDQVDHGSSPSTRRDRGLLDDVGVRRAPPLP